MPDHIPTVLDLDSYSTVEERRAYADGLRALADWVEDTRFPLQRYALRDLEPASTLTMYSSWIDDEDFVRRVGSAIKLIGGKVGKSALGGSYYLTRRFGPVFFTYVVSREAVCTPREEVALERKVVPVDAERAERLRAELDDLETVERDVPTARIVYDCPPSLLELEGGR